MCYRSSYSREITVLKEDGRSKNPSLAEKNYSPDDLESRDFKLPVAVLQILTVETNAQVHYYVFRYKLAPTCFGFIVAIRELTAYY
jgi:hypothetical protein